MIGELIEPVHLVINSIWHHLYELTQAEKMTIIITTHYIEEARLAHVVSD